MTANLYLGFALLIIGLVVLIAFIAWLRSLTPPVEQERTARYSFDDGVRLPEAGYGQEPVPHLWGDNRYNSPRHDFGDDNQLRYMIDYEETDPGEDDVEDFYGERR